MIRSKSGLPYKTIQNEIYKPDNPYGKRISTRKSVTYEICAVLPEYRSCLCFLGGVVLLISS
ncbi:MAG: hypothetical protein U0N91_07600 [Oscillospiraceae bacterium]|nr:hypothetical protein [Ruminococcus sp.]